MRRTNCRAFIRASIKQKLFIRILTREPICRSGRSLIIYLLLLSLLLPSRSMRPSAIISASLSSAIVIHRSFGIVKSRDVTPYNEKFAIPPAKYIVTRRNKSIGRWEEDGRIDSGRKYYPFAIEKLHYWFIPTAFDRFNWINDDPSSHLQKASLHEAWTRTGSSSLHRLLTSF